jgi:hypothetical protein
MNFFKLFIKSPNADPLLSADQSAQTIDKKACNSVNCVRAKRSEPVDLVWPNMIKDDPNPIISIPKNGELSYNNENIYQGFNGPTAQDLRVYYNMEIPKNQIKEYYDKMMKEKYPYILKIMDEIKGQKINDIEFVKQSENMFFDQTIYVDAKTFPVNCPVSLENDFHENFICISDIHLNGEKSELNIEAFKEKFKIAINQGKKFRALLVAGDLVQYGNDEEYYEVATFFEEVIRMGIKKIFFCGGNHDYENLKDFVETSRTLNIIRSNLSCDLVCLINESLSITDDDACVYYLCDSLVTLQTKSMPITIFGSPISHCADTFSFYKTISGGRGDAVKKYWEKIFQRFKNENIMPNIMMTHAPMLYGYGDLMIIKNEEGNPVLVNSGCMDFTQVYFDYLWKNPDVNPISAFVYGHIHSIPDLKQLTVEESSNEIYKNICKVTKKSKIVDDNNKIADEESNGMIAINVSVNKKIYCGKLLENEKLNNYYSVLTIGRNIKVLMKFIITDITSSNGYVIQKGCIYFSGIGQVHCFFNKEIVDEKTIYDTLMNNCYKIMYINNGDNTIIEDQDFIKKIFTILSKS